MEVYDDETDTLVEEEVYADFTCNNCDTPGARKTSGFSAHNADVHPCPWCECNILDVNKVTGYRIPQFKPRDDYTLLKHKFNHRTASDRRQEQILKVNGVRWSVFDWLPGWRPSKQTALDFMHCIYLGVVAWLFNEILFAAHLFPGAGGVDSPKKRFERAINSIQWPTHITRLPKNVCISEIRVVHC